jgi:hypothetical protein
MTQFTFTAGTIHLLGAANGKSLESDTASVKGCIAVLHSMGQTWKCASQSGDVLQRLLHEWNPKRASSDGAPATATKLNASGGVNIQEMLQQNPEMAQQLQRLGWAPPRLGIVPSSSSGFNPDPETLLTAPSYTVSITPSIFCGVVDESTCSEQILVFIAGRNPQRCDNSTTFRPARHGNERYFMDVTALRVDRSFLHLQLPSHPGPIAV